MMKLQNIRLIKAALTSITTLTVFFVIVNVGFDPLLMLHVPQAAAVVWSIYVIVTHHRHVYDNSDINHFNRKVVSPLLWVLTPLLVVMFVASCVGYLEFFSHLTDRKLNERHTVAASLFFHLVLIASYVIHALTLSTGARRLS